MIPRAAALAALMFLASPLAAAPEAAPEASLRPLARAVTEAPQPQAPPVTATPNGALDRPKARPGSLEAAQDAAGAQEPSSPDNPGLGPERAARDIVQRLAFAARSPLAIPMSLRPSPRSRAVVERALALRRERTRGAVCGDPALQGSEIGSVPGRISGCGLEDAIKLRSVSGLALSTRATIDCTTARALKAWVDKTVVPTIGTTGGGVAGLRVAASYACRGRNNQPGAKLSEHGKGRAIDIAAIRLKDGSEISVLDDWGSGSEGRMLRKLHSGACGPFGTVLGPESDRFHQDHFHLDTARYRAGSYCR
ncbi:extensin family protein [Salipiger mangrovisoli]|uniref:Extensin family protein n=1 Tax=Salipiger mangrovisoli TaxID=2865933 RepID=A0ABR9X1W3_9RHOB|nr:extensin family protein [Salipiger mangrovisoli]MBE9637558.1 extensin family protein [Salipiger mangrovisoli]